MRALGVFVFSSLGAAHVALNEMFLKSELELIEIAPLARDAQLMLMGDKGHLEAFLRNLRDGELKKADIISDLRKEVLEAYFALTNHAIAKALLIIESEFAGDLFRIANSLSGIEIVDFRLPRTPNATAVLMLTSENSDSLTKVRDQVVRGSDNLSAKLIRETSEGYRKFFGFNR